MSANAIRQYRPAFFEGWENETVEFKTLEELLAIPWVKNFAHSELSEPIFHRFSQSAVGDGSYLLMAEYRGGREWWVCGSLKEPVEGLPEWDHGIYEVMIDGKPAEVSGKDVSWSCGEEVGLRDGRVVKDRSRNEKEIAQRRLPRAL